MADLPARVREAGDRIGSYVRKTYLQPSAWLSRLSGGEVLLKLENLQHTGSFKVRGALNKVLSLPAAERARGVVAASTGNHGAAVAYALGKVGETGTVFVPRTAVPAKVQAIEWLGAELRHVGEDPLEAELAARSFASEGGKTYISPYNDADVIAGQGTVGLELVEQLSEQLGDQQEGLDAVFVAVGGGGLVSGIASYLKAVQPSVQIFGCLPARAPVMAECLREGQIHEVPSLPTLSDGTAGGLEEGAITFGLCQSLIDRVVLVSEAEIAAALKQFISSHHQLIEGAAAVALAGFLQVCRKEAQQESAQVGPEKETGQGEMNGKRIAIILCGANISPETLQEALSS
ncbi:MAG: threonine/serine dehydratase [Deltaproteobacteria bacterium]|nr:threonine/serine dehydratase [Deltaproteobacteria bacterium]